MAWLIQMTHIKTSRFPNAALQKSMIWVTGPEDPKSTHIFSVETLHFFLAASLDIEQCSSYGMTGRTYLQTESCLKET